jgi:ABC-type Fe3+/spermidine/putrescine transport system ATPase subunit
MATLAIEGLRKSFGATDLLKGTDLTLRSGEMLVIVGASGCGKSTLLWLIAELEPTKRSLRSEESGDGSPIRGMPRLYAGTRRRLLG